MKKMVSVLCACVLLLSLMMPAQLSLISAAASTVTSLLPTRASDFTCVAMGGSDIVVSAYGDGYQFASTGGWPAAHYMGEDDDSWAKAYVNQECYLNWDFEVVSGAAMIAVYFCGQNPTDQAGVGVGETINYLIDPSNNTLASGAVMDLMPGKYQGSVHVNKLGCRKDLIIGEGGDAYFTISGVKVFAVSGTVIIHDLSVGTQANEIVEPSVSEDQFVYNVLNDGTVEITGYNGYASQLDIPATIEGLPVTAIGEEAFAYCDTLTSVTIPEGVKTIGDYAFACYALSSVTIPASVTSIGEGAFLAGELFESIEVSEENAVYCDIDGVLFTKDQKTLVQYPCGKTATEYTIPDGVTTIGIGAFSMCESLASVIIPDSVTSIGYAAFSDCYELTNVVIGSGVKAIEDYAFFACAMESMAIPSGVTSIGEGAFFGCYMMKNVTIPASVTTIADYAFAYCEALTDVYYGGTQSQWNAILIGCENGALTAARLRCQTLFVQTTSFRFAISGDTASVEEYFGGANAVIPATIEGAAVTAIAEKAFQGHSELKTLELPNSIATIGTRAFDGCTALADVYYGGTESQWNAMTVGEYNYRLLAATRHYQAPALQGDWDGNNTINMMDALNVYSLVSSGMFPAEQTAQIDMNDDGAVDMMDCLLIFTIASGRV